MGISTIPLFRNRLFETFVLVFLILQESRHSNNRIALYLFLSLILIEIYHKIYFDNVYDFSTIRATLTSYLIGYAFVLKGKEGFVIPYIKIIYIYSTISLGIYFTALLSLESISGIEGFFSNNFTLENIIYGEKINSVNPIFFNFNSHIHNLRNNGPFWEPTIFAFHLILSLIFNLIVKKEILNKYNIVSFVCLITTISSTGIFAFFFLVIGIILFSQNNNIILKFSITSVLILVFFWAFQNLEFLGVKVFNEIDNLDYAILEKNGDTRLASAVLDWRESTQKIEYFMLGKGSQKETRIGSGEINALRNNGFTGLIVQRGFLFSLFYLYGIYFTFFQLCTIHKRNTKWSILFLGTLIILSQSEILFDLYFLHSLAFLGFILKANQSKFLIKYR